jgi:dTDP-4-amino-4,6-dideoxygalactose transaminase
MHRKAEAPMSTDERLACEGGAPLRTRSFPSWPVWDTHDEDALLQVLRSGRWGEIDGDMVGRFETRFAEFQQAQHCVAVVNGTAALRIAYRALDIGYGDEVIVPPYTFIATASAALEVGAIPVFADRDPDTYLLDPASVEEAITPRTRAIVPVHVAGCPADMDGLRTLAARRGLRVVEDAAQAPGATWNGQGVGSVGDLGTFSFQASKNLNAGEGGAIVTNDEALFRRVWSLHNVGRALSDDWRTSGWYQHDTLGFNYRLTEFQAALLLAQMSRLEKQMARREQAARFLDRELAAIPGIRPQARDPRVTAHAHHLYVLRYDPAAFGGHTRSQFLAALRAEGVPASGGYTDPLHRSPAVVRAVRDLCSRLGRPDDARLQQPLPVTERASAVEGVWLTQSVLLAETSDLQHIPEAMRKIQRAWAG